MKIESDDDRLILIAAFRYALGRASYMPAVVAEQIAASWNDMTEYDRKLFHGEIREAIDRGCAGMSCDVATWQRILDLPLAG